jgi:hypothetical protein
MSHVPSFTAEAPETAGKRFFQGHMTIYAEQAVAFAKKSRLEKLRKDPGTVTALMVRLSTNAADRPDGFDPESRTFKVVLRYEGGWFMETTFTLGSAFLDPPAFADVLQCLLSDIINIEDHTFESWCADFGYDTDSRKAEKTFNSIRDMLPLLRRLLGKDFAEIRDLEEDALMARFKDVPTFRFSDVTE